MRASGVLAVLALSGCSFLFMQPSTESRPPQCYEQYEVPVTDLAIAVIAGVITGIGVGGHVDKLTEYALPTSLVFSVSAMYGFGKRDRCQSARERWRAWCARVGSGERPPSCDEGW